MEGRSKIRIRMREAMGMWKAKSISVVLLLMLVAGISTAADVLDIGTGARSIGLGRTNTSVKADAYGIFGNPAGLRGITIGEIVSMYGTTSNDITYTMLGYVMPTNYGKFFAGYANNQTLDFTFTRLDATTGRPVAVSNFDFRNDLLMLGYQNSLSKAVSYGLRMKYFRKGAGNIAGYQASGINADAGVLVEANDRLTLGVTAKNIVPGRAGALNLSNGQTEDQVLGADVGLGFMAYPKLGVYADVSLNRHIPAEGKLGVEWKPLNMLAVRLGGEQKSSGGSSNYINGSAGIGLRLGIFAIDYAYYYDSLLVTNSRHFVSILIKTPNVTAAEPEFKKKIIPQVVTPIAETPKAEIASLKPAAPVVPVEEVKVPEVIEYVVVEGNCLSKIAEKFLGNWILYKKIAKDNNIKNPDLIFPKQKIVIQK
jgi:hypothetical protein